MTMKPEGQWKGRMNGVFLYRRYLVVAERAARLGKIG
jgi:hypothetical protein